MNSPIDRLVEALATSPSPGNLAAEIGKIGGVDIEFYQPKCEDRQTPHDRDELYVIARGSGTFEYENTQYPFEAGDVIRVPAHVTHRFSAFSEDFAAWVFFY